MRKRGHLARYYKKKHWGRGTFARVLDFIFLRAILFAACYLWFAFHLENTLLMALLSALALCFICVTLELIKSIRLEAFIQKERKRMLASYQRSKVLAMGDAAFESALKRAQLEVTNGEGWEDCVVFRQSAAVSADDLLPAVRNALKENRGTLLVFSLSPLSEKAFALCSELGVTLQNTPEALVEKVATCAGFDADKQTLEQILLDKLARKRKRWSGLTPFSVSRVRKYILVALALFACPSSCATRSTTA